MTVESEQENPVTLAAGVKCPYCPEGVFRWHGTAFLDSYGYERQGGYWRCDEVHWRRVSYSYEPATAEFHGGRWVVVDGRVKILRRAV